MILTSHVHSLESLSLKCVPFPLIQSQVLEGIVFLCPIIPTHEILSCHINSHNIFKPLERQLAAGTGGSNLRELRLNGCLLTWDQVSLLLAISGALLLSSSPFIAIHCYSLFMICISLRTIGSTQVLTLAPALPSLRSLELGLCRLKNLDVTSANLAEGEPIFPLLESLNFDSNNLSDWVGVCKGVKLLPRCGYLFSAAARLSNQTDVLTLP